MKKALIAPLLCLALASCAQHKSADELPEKISNKKTVNHRNIPGTRLFLVPPPGFQPMSGTTGLAGNNSMMQVMDLVGGNYYTNAAEVSKEGFERKGIQVLAYRELEVSGYPGKMVLLDANNGLQSYALFFGDTSFSTMVNSSFQTSDQKSGEVLKQAMETIWYDASLKVDPFTTAIFTLDDSKSLFKFERYSASFYFYTIGGVSNPGDGTMEAMVMVCPVPRQGTSLESIAAEMSNAIPDGTVKKKSSVITNGLPSQIWEIEGTSKGEKTLVYQHTVQIGDNAVNIQCIAYKNFDKYLPEFVKLANTIRAKQR